MKVDIHTIANDCKVAISTVSRVLNNRGYVSDKTRAKVLKSIRKHGYSPNLVASNLRKSKTSYIGLVIPSITYAFFSNLAKTIQDNLQQAGYSLFILNSDEDFTKEEFHIRSLLSNRVSGLILLSSNPEKLIEIIPEADLPVILVDRYARNLNKRKNTVLIGSDNFQGGLLATETLLEKGAKKMAFIMTENKTMPQQLREEGYITAMLRNKVAAENYRIVSSPDKPEEVTGTMLQLKQEFDFDALFCGNDKIAFGALYGLIENGIKVPEEVQVIGFDDIELVQYLKPSLSTIRQDIDKYGKTISSKIVSMVEGHELNEQIVIPVEFIGRDTTK